MNNEFGIESGVKLRAKLEIRFGLIFGIRSGVKLGIGFVFKLGIGIELKGPDSEDCLGGLYFTEGSCFTYQEAKKNLRMDENHL